MLRLIADLPAGTPVAFEAASGWGWLTGLLEDYGLEAHLVHPLWCKAIASARLKNDTGRRRNPSPAAARRPAPEGADRPAGGPAAPRAAAAPDRAGPAGHPAAEPDPRGGGRFQLRPVRQLPVRAGPRWLAGLDLPPASREIVAGALAVTDRAGGAGRRRGPRPHPQPQTVTKSRASSLSRHEPATGRARSSA